MGGAEVHDDLEVAAAVEVETVLEDVLEAEVVGAEDEARRRALDYDLEQERAYSYVGKSSDEMITHLTRFVSGLWQIHAFPEGNTRTTAVFVIQYLRSLGFKVDNDLFAKHSWYFRNALVRANYHNVSKGIDYSPVYLERFFRNLLLGDGWVLRNRYLHIHPAEEWRVRPNQFTPTSTPASTPASTSASSELVYTDNENIQRLVKVIGNYSYSIKDMLILVGLKDRMNFIEYTLNPAINEGFVRMLYPDSPRHPRQKYLLTEKGRMLYDAISKEKI